MFHARGTSWGPVLGRCQAQAQTPVGPETSMGLKTLGRSRVVLEDLRRWWCLHAFRAQQTETSAQLEAIWGAK